MVDPYRSATAELADMHLALRPGTDGALACGVMHVLFKEGLADRDYLARYSDVPDELERHLRARTPAWASAITGLPEAEILAFARLYGGTKRAFLRLGYGFTRSRNGAAAMHAASCLPVVTGAWQHRGRRCALQFRRALPLGQDDDRGPGRPRSQPSASSTSRASARSWSASPRPWPAAARSMRC